MVRSQGRWVRSLAYGATALLVISACSQSATVTTAPSQPGASTAPASQAAPPSYGSVDRSRYAGGGPQASTQASTPGEPNAEHWPERSAPGEHRPSASAAAKRRRGNATPGGTIYMLRTRRTSTTTIRSACTPARTSRSSVRRSPIACRYKYSEDPAEGVTIVPDMATDIGTASDDVKSWSFTLRDGLTWQDGSPVTCEDVAYGVSRTFAADVITGGPTYAIVIPRHPEGR